MVWVSPQERRALKRVAAEADVTVADLIRSLAAGLDAGVIAPAEILHHVQIGLPVMQKIPTLFERGDDFTVTDQVRPGCEWVLAGEGAATEKLDGTNVRLTIRGGTVVRVEKRRNPSKKQKAAGIKDGWYVDASRDEPQDKWMFVAVDNTDVTGWPDGEHPAEALGPNIRGNDLGLDEHVCVPFDLQAPRYAEVPRTFEGLRETLPTLGSLYHDGATAEGIVFHHPDGRRAKIKRKDFVRGR